MDYVSIFLAGMILGIFVCVTLYALIVAFRSQPASHGFYIADCTFTAPPNMAQMPVHEAGIVAYQFLGVTGEEQP